MELGMKKKRAIGQAILTIIFAVMCVAVISPFVLLVSVSLSTEADISKYGYLFIPKEISWVAYEYVFKNPRTILNAYWLTFRFALTSMVLTTVMTSLFAYPLSRTNFKPRQKLSFFMYFTTMFGGGLVPYYLLITRYLHLKDTFWVYVIPGMFSVWSAFVMRTFFKGIPESLIDSAYIDGAGEYRILFQIMYPLSKPVLATMACGTFLGQWNNWNTSLMYIDDPDLYSLQYMLQKILRELTLLQDPEFNKDLAIAEQFAATMEIPAEPVRMAMAVVVAGPILFVFPFFQKYFTKGMVMGSVKG